MTVPLPDFFARCPAMLFIADGDGSLVHTSAALHERFAARLGDHPTLASLAAQPDREIIDDFMHELAETDEPVVCSFRVAEGDAHVHLRCEARRHSDGSIFGRLELVSPTTRIEHVLLRALVDTLDIAVWAVDARGQFVYHDGKALATAGLERGQHLGKNVFEIYPSSHTDAIHAALAGNNSHDFAEARGAHWETWYVALPNEAGETEFCAGVSLDITAAVEKERALERQIETITAQQQAIRELSTPVIGVWDQVLTVPLIGELDPALIEEFSERLLDACQADVRFAILDMTGVAEMDTASAAHLLRLLGSLRLLGVEGLITGISPKVALTMTTLGIELGAFRTFHSLRDGLRACMQARRS